MVLEINLKIAKFHMNSIFAIIPPELIVNWVDEVYKLNKFIFI